MPTKTQWPANDTHCAIGWVGEVFHTEELFFALEMLKEVVGYRYINSWTDDRKTTKQQIADALNAVMTKLGYTEDCYA